MSDARGSTDAVAARQRQVLSRGRAGATTLRAIGTAVPRHRHRQADAAEFMKRSLGADPALARRLDFLYRRSRIDTRHSCLPNDDEAGNGRHFYPPLSDPRPAPTTRERMQAYRREALPLCRAAIDDALRRPAAPPLADVAHLVVVSCTGFYAPGLDVDLARALGLPAHVQRTLVGFMGCCAAFNGMRLADALCRSQPDATVLMVCAELCTLHFQQSLEDHHLVANCLFADGAAAAFFTRGAPATPSLRLVDSITHLDGDSLDAMAWDIGDTGFEMWISPSVAEVIGERAPAFVERLLAPHGLTRRDIDAWAVHPGGRSILDQIERSLHLAPHQLDDSRAVLRDYGNMSSPTILFVLRRLLDRLQAGEPFRRCLAMAFGPGLTLEAGLFEAARDDR